MCLDVTRQGTSALSDANRLLIRCAWAGESAFDSEYGSSWVSGYCPYPFATKASLETAVQMWVNDQATALSTYGPLSVWVVSSITDMGDLFSGLQTFNEDISSWDTSGVTSMYWMFEVCPPRVPWPQDPPCTLRAPPPPPRPPAPSPGVSPSMCLRVTRQDASAFNQPLSLDTSRVTNMHYMFKVRPPRAIWPQSPLGPSVHTACTATTLHALPSLSPSVPPSTCVCVTRQGASAFNQPLSFDTSSVTEMRGMFRVRPPRACRAPQCPIGSSVHAVCTATAPHRPRAHPQVSRPVV